MNNEFHSIIVCSKLILFPYFRSSESSGIKKKNADSFLVTVPLEEMMWKLENLLHLANARIFPAYTKNKRAAKSINYP